jgi:hypothetical protein
VALGAGGAGEDCAVQLSGVSRGDFYKNNTNHVLMRKLTRVYRSSYAEKERGRERQRDKPMN